eukprot:COSAG06_NODE_6329_length_2981_cov_26.469119_2_plen_140_part_00
MRQQPAQPSPALPPACPPFPQRGAAWRSSALVLLESAVRSGTGSDCNQHLLLDRLPCPALTDQSAARVSAACVCTTVARMRLDQRLHPSVRSGPQVCVPSPTPSHHCILYRIVLSVPCSTTTVSISIYRLHLDPHDGAF